MHASRRKKNKKEGNVSTAYTFTGSHLLPFTSLVSTIEICQFMLKILSLTCSNHVIAYEIHLLPFPRAIPRHSTAWRLLDRLATATTSTTTSTAGDFFEYFNYRLHGHSDRADRSTATCWAAEAALTTTASRPLSHGYCVDYFNYRPLGRTDLAAYSAAVPASATSTSCPLGHHNRVGHFASARQNRSRCFNSLLLRAFLRIRPCIGSSKQGKKLRTWHVLHVHVKQGAYPCLLLLRFSSISVSIYFVFRSLLLSSSTC